MTRRPERLKATKLYGSGQVNDNPKPLENKNKAGKNQSTQNIHSSKLKSGNTKVADKELPKYSVTDKKSKKEDGKKIEIKKNHSNKLEMKDTHQDDRKKELPKGFVSREEMEKKVSKRKSQNDERQQKPLRNQTHTSSDSKNKIAFQENEVPKVPTGFVTRIDMETRIKNRKTKSTKITPTFHENNVQMQTTERHQIPSVHSGRDQQDIDKPDPKSKHIFSKLEKRTQVVTEIKEDLPLTDHRVPTQRKQGDKKGSKTTKNSTNTKPTLTDSKRSGEILISKTNTKEVNKEERKTVLDSNDSDRMTSASTRKSSSTLVPRMTSTAIPKATKPNAKSNNFSGVKLESVKILIMNANGKDDKGGTPPERRRNAIQNVVLKHMPHIVLFQEFSWAGITGKTWAKYPIPEHFVYKGHYDASIMYDATCITVQDLPASDIDTIFSGLQSNANNRLKRTFPMDFTPVARMSMSRITAPTKPALDFICISWHGRSNETGGGRMKELKKIEYFEYFMEFLRNIREKYKLPILAAGDYNVDMYSIEKCVQSPFKLCIYEASMRRTVKGIVDFCIVTDDLDFSDVTWVNLERDTTVFHPNGILDHDPIVGSLTVSALGASNAALGLGKKKTWPSPIAKTR